ncbi:MAG: hypothetical protein QXQ57_03170 [Sulfolobales archaeon]
MEDRFEEILREYEEEGREIRRKEADWDFINKQPPRIRAALIYYIEKGDLRMAQRLSGLSLEEFIELLERARIPRTYF